ncbi:MAG: hypothetical protein HC777_02070 [Hyphomonadaceae bacterium]|nr:hypothetical protein [Hyphomonadaceae bacterium]
MTEREYRMILSKAPRASRSKLAWMMVLFWLVASLIGAATQVFAGSTTGLRGSQEPAVPQTKSAAKSKRSSSAASPQAWLGNSIWRAGPCESAQNFQTFAFSASASKVEVGSGKRGDGEELELLRIGEIAGGLIQIETRVCAPVGCNQTIERYKKLDANTMQEWHFEGRLPNIEPYVIVANGAALDGSGPGRVFHRCGV